ncbi:class I SAM-dependent methyltransferase [Lapillicoccus jejuensis]|uniref:Nodulation protein S (NodS) n=1 Tax=Lapillicoccus jejuensis TaxID=402171 RepID=A0A542DXK2_9MICO|nr:class I SAM-dependent methyltransferase [Lapillicoccus jejuensis]TQJ07821.1 nodulation protein S (NodS) [Lapillicoccus jejuensis]
MDTAYFTRMYDAAEDPWEFASRWYEQRKYGLCLAMLPRPRYRRVLEPACSVGVLTVRLAERADEVVASDLVPVAVERARERVHREVDDPTRVTLGEGDLRDPLPDGPVDLVVLSECLYYLHADEQRDLVERVLERLSDDGHVLASHWRPRVPEYHQDGDEVHDALERTPGLRVLADYGDDDVRIAVLARQGAASVATAGGLRADLGS